MITWNVTDTHHGKPPEGYCLSTDTKPTDAPNASVLYEMDTKMLYMFDEQNGVWIEQ